MAKRKTVDSVAVKDRYGNVEVKDLSVRGENVKELKWEHIRNAPKLDAEEGESKAGMLVRLDESGKLPEGYMPVNAEGKLPASMIPGQSALGIKVFQAGPAAPEDTSLLWIDTTEGTGGLKYHNGTAWVHVPVAYT